MQKHHAIAITDSNIMSHFNVARTLRKFLSWTYLRSEENIATIRSGKIASCLAAFGCPVTT